MTELTSKNLYDYLSKNNAKQRKIERIVEVFDADQVEIEKLLMAGESWGIFIYDAEDGWKTQEFSKIDSKKFFDFVYQGVIPTSTPKKEEKAPVKKESPKPVVKKEAPKPIRKVTEAPKNLASPAPEKKEEPVVQKPFSIRALFKLILDKGEDGIAEAKIYNYFVVKEEDLRFVLDYLEFKGFYRRDTMTNWYANAELAKDPMLDKTLIGLRNSAILNNEFKKKATRSSGR